MAPPPSDSIILKPGDEIYRKPEPEFRLLDKSDSLLKEKQISVDPISLRELLPSIDIAPKNERLMELPPSLIPGKLKFLSCSLPNSATSSPRFGSTLLKKFRNDSHSRASPLQYEYSYEANPEDGHMQPTPPMEMISTTTTLPLEFYLRRSKSCGEGRSFAPSEDFDLWISRPDFAAQIDNDDHAKNFPTFSMADLMTMNDRKFNRNRHHNKKSNENHKYNNTSLSAADGESAADDGFKCGALCLFLPAFSKAKAVRPTRKVEEEGEGDEEEYELKNASAMISRTVSLEKFECGSWASSAIGDSDAMNSYFDLPMELIRSSSHDAHSPVSTAFLFDKDIKGVLKNGSRSIGRAERKSNDSTRHVRFSTASPTSYPASPATCITPRLRKAREDFNAFLEAQSA